MSKYRYVSCCGLFITSGDYFIDIPSPNIFDKEDDAEKDHKNIYRFVKTDSEVILGICKDGELYKKDSDSILVTLNGNLKPLYTEGEFKRAGGKIFECKEVNRGIFENGDEISISWSELFKDEEIYKAIYIDDEAYYIDIIED